MKVKIGYWCVMTGAALMLVLSASASHAQAAGQQGGWEVLFDGTSTEKWRGYNKIGFPDFGWKVEGGMLIVEKSDGSEEGNAGSIITRKKYRDFELELEYMISDSSNSGILYLVEEVDETPIWHNAPEYQIIDNPTYDEIYGKEWMNTRRAGDNYDLQMADKDYSKPVGKWNRARVVKKGNHVEHWLNGHKTIEYEINSPAWKALVAKSKFKDYPGYAQAKEGHIGLQDHGHKVAFRNMRIREF